MRLSVSLLVALISTPFLALADNPNPFKIPASGLSAKGGQALDLQWTPTTTGTVSLILRSGKSTDLDEGSIIASHISNSGSYTWTPDNGLTSGSDYTVEIVDDSDPSQSNYTPPFVLDTTTTQSQSLSQVTLGAPTATASGRRHRATDTDSLLTASSSFSIPIHNSFTHKTLTTSGVTVISATMSHSTSTASASSTASSTPTAQATSTASVASNAAPRATAMAGGLFGLALGVLAL